MLRLQFLAIVFLTVAAAFAATRIKPGIDLAGGAELRYKVLFDPKFKDDRGKATKEAADVVRRRLESKQLMDPRILSHGDDEILFQLPGVDADGLREIKALIEKTGNLELFAAASQELQGRYERDGVVPTGYKPVGKWLGESRAVVEGRHIVRAAAVQDVESGWATEFELDTEGARRFDEAAERLYHRSPRGRIVIVLDDKVQSAPVVNSPAFHGRGQISAGSRRSP